MFRCVLSWIVPEGAAGVTREALSLFTVVHPRPEIVYVGLGDADEVVHSFSNFYYTKVIWYTKH